MTKQWQTQSEQHDGMTQINGYFYSSLTFSDLKTRKKKKEIISCQFHVSKKKEKEKK